MSTKVKCTNLECLAVYDSNAKDSNIEAGKVKCKKCKEPVTFADAQNTPPEQPVETLPDPPDAPERPDGPFRRDSFTSVTNIRSTSVDEQALRQFLKVNKITPIIVEKTVHYEADKAGRTTTEFRVLSK